MRTVKNKDIISAQRQKARLKTLFKVLIINNLPKNRDCYLKNYEIFYKSDFDDYYAITTNI